MCVAYETVGTRRRCSALTKPCERTLLWTSGNTYADVFCFESGGPLTNEPNCVGAQVAKCHLHTGVLMSRLRQHGEAIRCNGQILQMVDEGKLEGNGTDQEKICMIAICYHNIAVDHLMLQQVHEACVASQNARRLARLCLAYANRYMRFFESTHGTALEALEKTKDVRESFASREDRKLFKNLSADLYS